MDKESDIAAIKEVFDQYVECLNTGNFDLFMSFWADDAVQMSGNTPTRIGKEQIRMGFKPAFNMMNLEMDIPSLDEIEVFGDIGLTRCTYTLKMTPKAGGETITAVPNGRDLALLKRQSDGSWKFAYDSSNSPVPPS